VLNMGHTRRAATEGRQASADTLSVSERGEQRIQVQCDEDICKDRPKEE
jgi:hypothetical protein